ncbi:charged multivesicular body protein 6-B [Cantharellus anzutake]|uniref:charged multivesicular body protein 6-B n=1 Tax=Cantharellus anzutake TaxID=1750568 RepID=UPI0019070C8D|nr:charged multivesicular body protein 6-B [Cantharellus anzutake]KAF8331494.1 charged multivesicular body protein 6-B [Cantharellus anzutake]
MGNGSSVPKVTAQDRAVLDLKNQRDKLRRYQKQIQHVLDREQAIAKEALAAGKKDRALTALRRRKYQEGLLSKTDAQLETLQGLVSSIEFSLVQRDVLHGLKLGNHVLSELHRQMKIEDVEKLMSETADGIAYQKEINELLMNEITNEEEDAVQEELARLEREALPQRTQTEGIHLPDVPATEPERQTEDATAASPERVALPA